MAIEDEENISQTYSQKYVASISAKVFLIPLLRLTVIITKAFKERFGKIQISIEMNDNISNKDIPTIQSFSFAYLVFINKLCDVV